MHLGITYDLREEYLALGYSLEATAEFDSIETIDALDKSLVLLGHTTSRIGNIRSLVGELAQGKTWDLVFNISEGMYGFSREAQIPALLDAYAIPYTFSDPLTLTLALHKGMAKRVVRDVGIPTAPFAIVNVLADCDTLTLPYPLFAKPIAEGTGKGITAASRISSCQDLKETCSVLLATYKQPVLVETYLAGREFTVGITGYGALSSVIGSMEIVMRDKADQGVYTYRNKEFCEELVDYRTTADADAQKAEAVALAAWNALGCRDAGRVDIRLDGTGVAHFIEVNPVAGMHPTHSDLPMICSLNKISYTELIERIIKSAAARSALCL